MYGRGTNPGAGGLALSQRDAGPVGRTLEQVDWLCLQFPHPSDLEAPAGCYCPTGPWHRHKPQDLRQVRADMTLETCAGRVRSSLQHRQRRPPSTEADDTSCGTRAGSGAKAPTELLPPPWTRPPHTEASLPLSSNAQNPEK